MARPFTTFSAVVLASLYFSQGLPSGFLAHAMPALMREHGVAVEYIGLVKLLALPWFLKFLWAPYVDRTRPLGLSLGRGWMILMQSGVIVLLLIIAQGGTNLWFGSGLLAFFLLLILLNSFAATQDIATDGLAVRILPPRLRGVGNSIQVTGYKIGLILGGSLLLIALDELGWQTSFSLVAGTLAVLIVPVLLYRDSRSPAPAEAPHQIKHADDAGQRSGFWATYRDFFVRPGMMLYLSVLATYKIADSLGSTMIKAMLVDMEFSLTEIGQISFVASLAGLLGAVTGGALYYRLGPKTCMLLFGLLQALGLGAFAPIALGATSLPLVYAVSIFEQIADGMSTVVLFSLMMSYCRPTHEGADYTVQASIQVTISGMAGVLSGWVVSWLGYPLFFGVAAGLGVAALIPVLMLFGSRPAEPAVNTVAKD